MPSSQNQTYEAPAYPRGLSSGRAFPRSAQGAKTAHVHAQTLLSLLIAAAFGPYLLSSTGLRLEHIVVYPLAVITLMSAISRRPLAMRAHFWALIILWSAAISWMLLITAVLGRSFADLRTLGTLENLLQPLALLLVIGLLTRRSSSRSLRRYLRATANWTIVLLSGNTIISLASIYTDTWPLIGSFVRQDAAGISVSERAASMGRYSGVFNQPFEAGVAYSIGLIALVYLLRLEPRRTRPWLLIGGTLLATGGLLTVSKVFIFGGAPLCILYAVWTLTRSAPLRLGELLFGIGLAGGLVAVLGTWSGQDHLARFFDRAHIQELGLLRVFSAGRYGDEGTTVVRLFVEAWTRAPLHGFGLGAYSPLDNALLEFFYQGGAVALAAYVLVLLVLLRASYRAVRVGTPEGKLSVALWVLIVGAGLGAPVLTINRASILLWVLLLLALSVSPLPGAARPAMHAQANREEFP